MRKLAYLVTLILLLALSAKGQSTTVSGTITDANGQAFSNGTYRISFNPNGVAPPFQWNGSPFTPGNFVFSGSLNSSGAFSGVSVPSNTFIAPGTLWEFQVCPAATAPCYSQSLTVAGATMSVSTLLTPPPIVVTASAYSQPTAYTDAEIVGPIVGFQYFNLTSQLTRICTVSIPCTWVNGGGGGGGGSVTDVTCVTGCTVANPTTTPAITVTAGAPGGSTDAVQFNAGGGSFGGTSVPSTNGMYDCLFNVTSSTAVPPTCPQVGLAGTPGLTGATSTYTIAYSDNAQAVVHDAAGSAAIVVTLPTPATLGNPEFVTSYCNYSAFIDTITPTTWTINGQTSLTVPTNTCYRISVDPNNTALSKTNWIIGPAGPVINGVAYSNLYPQATLDGRVNACAIDAETGAHGAVSHICDSQSEAVTQTFANQITIGDSSGSDWMTWLVPPTAVWTCTATTGSCLFQYGYTRIHGTEAPSRMQIRGGASGAFAMYSNGTTVGYYDFDGIFFYNPNGYTFTSGADMIIQQTQDESIYDNFQVGDYGTGNTYQLWVGGSTTASFPCCATKITNATVYGNNTGPIDLYYAAGSGGNAPTGNEVSGSFGHAGAGKPEIEVVGGRVNFGTVYIESNNASTVSPVDISGDYANVHFDYLHVNVFGTASTVIPVLIHGSGTTNVTIDDVTTGGSGAYSSYPITMVQDTSATCASSPCNAASDTRGTLSYYTNFKVTTTALYVFGSATFNALTASGYVCTDGSKNLSSTCPTLPIANGGTNATTAAAARINLFPTASEVGDLVYCATFSGSACTSWALLPGNTSGTQFLQETSAGVPSWSSGSSSIAWSAISNPSGNQALTMTGDSTTWTWGSTAFAWDTSGHVSSSVTGAASQSAFTWTGNPFTGGSGTTTFPMHYDNCTGSSAPSDLATTGAYYGINTCSGFTGNFFQYHVNGATAVATLSAAGNLTIGGTLNATGSVAVGASNNLTVTGRSKIGSSADGLFTLSNNAVTSFTRLNFGGATSSFAGLCFSATAITVCDASGGTAGTFNSPSIGAGTPGTGAFTTLSASSTVSGTGFSTYLASPPAIGGTAPAAGSFTTLGATGLATLSGGAAVGSSPPTCSSFAACFGTGGIQSLAYATTTNCASGASPAVCGSAPAGAVAIPTGANPTLVVNTSAVTANSRIILEVDDTDTISGTTCNSTLLTLVGGEAITARTAGTSFTISFNGTVTTNPVCVSYWIVN